MKNFLVIVFIFIYFSGYSQILNQSRGFTNPSNLKKIETNTDFINGKPTYCEIKIDDSLVYQIKINKFIQTVVNTDGTPEWFVEYYGVSKGRKVYLRAFSSIKSPYSFETFTADYLEELVKK